MESHLWSVRRLLQWWQFDSIRLKFFFRSISPRVGDKCKNQWKSSESLNLHSSPFHSKAILCRPFNLPMNDQCLLLRFLVLFCILKGKVNPAYAVHSFLQQVVYTPWLLAESSPPPYVLFFYFWLFKFFFVFVLICVCFCYSSFSHLPIQTQRWRESAAIS